MTGTATAERGRVEALDHVLIAVKDLGAAADRYARLLGRGKSWAGTHPGLGTSNILFRLANMYVELIAKTGDGPFAQRLERHIAENGEGLFGAAFASRDLAGLASRLEGERIGTSGPHAGAGRDSDSGAVRRWRNLFFAEEDVGGVFLFAIEHSSDASLLPLAPVEAAGAVTGLDHVVLHTGRPERAIALFGEALGLRLALDKAFPEWGARLQFFRLGGLTFEVASALPPTDDKASGHDRWGGLSYRTDDIDAAHARLVGEGFDVSPVRVGRKPGTRVLTVRAETAGVPTLFISATAQ